MLKNGWYLVAAFTFLATMHITICAMGKENPINNNFINSNKFADICIALRKESMHEISSPTKIYQLLGKTKLIRKKDQTSYNAFDPITIIEDFRNRSLIITAPNKITDIIKECFPALETWCLRNNNYELLTALGLIFFKSQKDIEDSSSETKTKILNKAFSLFKQAYSFSTPASFTKTVSQAYIDYIQKEHPKFVIEKPPIPLVESKEKIKIVKPTHSLNKKKIIKKENNPIEEIYQNLIKQKNYSAAAECAWQLLKEKNGNYTQMITKLESLTTNTVDALYYLVDHYKNEPNKAIEYFIRAERTIYEKNPMNLQNNSSQKIKMRQYSAQAQKVALEALDILAAQENNQIPHLKATHYYYESEKTTQAKKEGKYLQLAYDWATKPYASKETPLGCVPLFEIENDLAMAIYTKVKKDVAGKSTSELARYIVENDRALYKAKNLLLEAIEHGSTHAMHNLGIFYLSQFVELVEYSLLEQGISLLLQAAQNNVPEAAQHLEKFCLEGVSYEIPLTPALRLQAINCLKKQTCYDSVFIRKLINQIEPQNGAEQFETVIKEALYYFDMGDYKKTFKLFQELAAQNDWRAVIFLHGLYLDGIGTQKSFEKAMECLQSILNKKILHPTKNLSQFAFCMGLISKVDQDQHDELATSLAEVKYVKLYQGAALDFGMGKYQDGLDTIGTLLQNAIRESEPISYIKFFTNNGLIPKISETELNSLESHVQILCKITLRFLKLAHNLYISKLPARYKIAPYDTNELLLRQICELHPVLGPCFLAKEHLIGTLAQPDIAQAIRYINQAIKNLESYKNDKEVTSTLENTYRFCKNVISAPTFNHSSREIFIKTMTLLDENILKITGKT